MKWCREWVLVLVFSLSLQVMGATKWALLVGISDYLDDRIADLRYAALDAAEFRDTLVNFCGFDAGHVKLLINSEATKENVEKSLADIARLASPEDTVVVYFSGHGSSVRDTDGDERDGDGLDEVFLPYDAELGQEETYIIDDILGYWIARIPAQNVAIFLDFCHSGGQGKSVDVMGLGARGAGDSMARDIFTDPEAKPGRAVLTACQAREVAYEAPDLRHGVFTYFILQGIKNKLADYDYDRQVTMDELANYVRQNVANWATRNGYIQTPYYGNPTSAEIVIVPNIPFSTPSTSLPVDGEFNVEGLQREIKSLQSAIQGLQIISILALISAFIAILMNLF